MIMAMKKMILKCFQQSILWNDRVFNQ